jgi:hypothetical protein
VRKDLAALAVLVLLVTGAAGCATIKPWEREVLAREDMTFTGNPELAESELHATDTREGAHGGLGGGGGGCGCN